MQLSEAFRQGRDNNFNLIRIIAASAVLVAHSWPLALGPAAADPVARTLGLGLGGIAVDIFFLTSGFLVTASILRLQHAGRFLLARALRIFPALVVVVLCCVLLGAAMTSLPLGEYATHPDTWRFVWRNATQVKGMFDSLPGVFTSNPHKGVNGSLWTLQMELRMYLVLVLLWVLAALAGRYRARAFGAAIVVSAAVMLALHLAMVVAPGHLPVFSRWSYPTEFLLGAACFVLRDRIRLDARLFLAAVACTVAAGAWADQRFMHAAYYLVLPYVVLFLAYVPGGAVRRVNAWGDVSYGVYIMAYPVQQTLAAVVPGIGVAGMLTGAAVTTLPLAWCSWRWIEKPALGLKRSAPQPLLSELGLAYPS